MKKLLQIVKKDIVLTIAVVAAIVSMFFVHPNLGYFSYIDYRVLAILFGLMLIVEGVRMSGAFDRMIGSLTGKLKSTIALELILIYICFFSSMFITNDVALITFVPFAIVLLDAIGRNCDLIYVVVMQTIAANLGSMVTPIGNPQNLYVYTSFEMSIGEFAALLLPYAGLSFVLMTLTTVLHLLVFNRIRVSRGKLPEEMKHTHFFAETKNAEAEPKKQSFSLPIWKLILLGVLFVIALLTVLRVLDYRIMLGIIVAGILIVNPRLFAKADYVLLATFVAFFILVGNLKSIPAISNWLAGMMGGREFFVTLLCSQVISNVPATMLLSGFTDNGRALILGADIGGLGTIIASMASLISLRQYNAVPNAKKGKYFAWFTLWNLVFLGVMLCLYFLLN